MAPTNLTVTVLSPSKIKLTWKDNANNKQGVKIERNGIQIATLNANLQSYTDSKLCPNTTYQYRVRSYHTTGDSAYSNQVSTATPPQPSSKPPPPPEQPPAGPGVQTVIHFYIRNDDYYLNGQQSKMDVAPLVMENRTLLPIRFVAEPLGALVEWSAPEQKATVILGEKTAELWLGQNPPI